MLLSAAFDSLDPKPARAARRRANPLDGAVKAPPRPAPRRAPPNPGHFLETRYLKPLGITQQALASLLGVSRRRVNELIRGHRSITADTAVRLGLFFGNEPSFWMQLQTDWDLHEATKAYQTDARQMAVTAAALKKRKP